MVSIFSETSSTSLLSKASTVPKVPTSLLAQRVGFGRAQNGGDTVSERSRRWTRNPLGSARRGSNPLGVVLVAVLLLMVPKCAPARIDPPHKKACCEARARLVP